MSKVPTLSYEQIISALRRDGWVVETLKLTVPAHRPVLSSTLAHILKQARLSVDQLNDLL